MIHLCIPFPVLNIQGISARSAYFAESNNVTIAGDLSYTCSYKYEMSDEQNENLPMTLFMIYIGKYNERNKQFYVKMNC